MHPHPAITIQNPALRCYKFQSSLDLFPQRSLEIFSSSFAQMDTSNPAVLVNGELLGRYVGRKVRAVIQVIRSDGEEVTGKSADDRQLIVKGSAPSQLTNFVEIIGIADSGSSITADRWTNFGDTFDASSHNKLCQLANGEFQHMFL